MLFRSNRIREAVGVSTRGEAPQPVVDTEGAEPAAEGRRPRVAKDKDAE